MKDWWPDAAKGAKDAPLIYNPQGVYANQACHKKGRLFAQNLVKVHVLGDDCMVVHNQKSKCFGCKPLKKMPSLCVIGGPGLVHVSSSHIVDSCLQVVSEEKFRISLHLVRALVWLDSASPHDLIKVETSWLLHEQWNGGVAYSSSPTRKNVSHLKSNPKPYFEKSFAVHFDAVSFVNRHVRCSNVHRANAQCIAV